MNKALFLDRDGVINIEKNYLHKIQDFEFVDGIFELCNHFQQLGYLIIVVTNQSGIARGYYNENDFSKLTSWMNKEFLKNNIIVSNVYFCPHHPDISGPCDCRKPNPGMLLKARDDYNILLNKSIIVGDKERDIQAGINAGLTRTYLFTKDNIEDSQATKVVSKLEDIWIDYVDFK